MNQMSMGDGMLGTGVDDAEGALLGWQDGLKEETVSGIRGIPD